MEIDIVLELKKRNANLAKRVNFGESFNVVKFEKLCTKLIHNRFCGDAHISFKENYSVTDKTIGDTYRVLKFLIEVDDNTELSADLHNRGFFAIMSDLSCILVQSVIDPESYFGLYHRLIIAYKEFSIK